MSNVPGVCFEPGDLRKLDDGTTVRVRYKTAQSNYENERSIEGTVRVVDEAVHVGAHKVYTSNSKQYARSRGEVVKKRPTNEQLLGIFYRAEVQADN